MSNKAPYKIDVLVNNEQAKGKLKELETHLETIKRKRLEAMEQGNAQAVKLYNDELKKTGNEILQIQRKWTDVDGVLKNMSGSSVRELKTAYSQLRKELDGMKQTDPGYAAKKQELDQLKNALNNTGGSVTGFSDAWSSAKGVMALAAGVMAGLSGAIGFGKSVIESTAATAREFKSITTGLSWAWDEFKKAIATSDFTGLITNMGEAISAGREYVNTLEDVKKSTRALSITNSELNIEFQKLKVIERDVSKPMEERIAAGKKALDVEVQMTKGSQEIAKKAMDAELLHLRTITKLKEEDIKASVATYNSNKKNLDMANEYNKANENFQAKNSQALSQMQATPEGKARVDEMRQLVKNATPDIKQLASVMKAMGKTTGEELDGLAEKWVAYNNIESESIQKTARVQITLGRLNKGYIDDTNRDEKAAAKEREKIVKEAHKTLSQLITEKDAEIEAAIQAGDIPLAEKTQIEKKALEDLAATYKAVKEEIAKGWDLNQRDQGTIDKLVSIGSKLVKSDKPESGILVKRNTESGTGPSEADKAKEDKEQQKKSQIKDASFAAATEINNAVFNIVKNRQQAEFDHKMSLLEKEKERELSNKNLTEAQKDAINAKYAKKEAALKTEAFKKQKAADIIQAVINTALAITNALATGGPAAPVMAIATGIAGAAQIAVIAAQKPPEFYEGGYTGPDSSDKKPVGIVHANEFIGTADAVRNPSIKRYFDAIDYAQKTGAVSQLNLSAIEPNINSSQRGFKSGGYTTSTISDPTQISNPGSVASNQLSNDALSITREIAKQIALEFKDGIKGKWVLNDFEKIQKDKRNIEKSTDM